MKKPFLALAAFAATTALTCGITNPATAAEAPTTEVELSDGVRVTSTLDLRQDTARNEALRAVREARAHYYDENIVFDGLPLQDAVASAGLSRDDYVNIRWDNALERISIQRTAEEIYSGRIDHERPDGSSASTASYKGTSARAENLCEATSANSCLNSFIKDEEQALKDASGFWSIDNGHLHTILRPTLVAMGFSFIDGFGGMHLADVHSGETTAAPNGVRDISVAVPASDLDKFRLTLGRSTLPAGHTTTYEFAHNGYSVPGTVTVDDSSIVTVDGNELRAVAEGTTTVRYVSEDGKFSGSDQITVDNDAPANLPSSIDGNGIAVIIIAILTVLTGIAAVFV